MKWLKNWIRTRIQQLLIWIKIEDIQIASTKKEGTTEELDYALTPAQKKILNFFKGMFWLQPLILFIIIPVLAYLSAKEVIVIEWLPSYLTSMISVFVSLVTAVGIYLFGMRPRSERISMLKKKFVNEDEQFVKHLHYYEEIELAIDRNLRKIAEFEGRKEPLNEDEKKKLEDLIKNREVYAETYADFENNVINPRKKNQGKLLIYRKKPTLVGDSIPKWYKPKKDEKEDETVMGLSVLRMKVNDIQKDQVTDAYIISVVSLIFAGFNLILALLGYADEGVWFGIYMKSGLAILTVLLIMYMTKSFTLVEQTEVGLYLFLGKPFREITVGWHPTPLWLVGINKIDMTQQYANIKEDSAYLTGDEAQTVRYNPSQPWRINDIWKAITMLGLTMNDIRKKMEGKSEEGGITEQGMIADKVRGIVRSWLADSVFNSTLDDALVSRKSMMSLIKGTLNKEYGYMGIYFDIPNMPDIDPEDDIVKLRNETVQATQETVKEEQLVLKEVQTAKKVAAKAAGEADKIQKEGDAAAYVIEKIGKSEAKAVEDKLKANVEAVAYLKEKGVAEKAIPMIATMIMAEKSITEIAKALQGMNVNLYQVDGFEKIIDLAKSVTGLSSLLAPTETES